MTDAQARIITLIEALLVRANKPDVVVTPDALLHGEDGLGLDSLETAELSAVLEDEFGSDPFGAGQMPETVAEVADFYATEGEPGTSVPA